MAQSQSEQKFYEYGYKFFIKQNNQEIDWEQRRYEIAKDLLSALVTTHGNCQDENWHITLSECAVNVADALIAELKK